MSKYFEIECSKNGLRVGKLVLDDLQLTTPLLVHSGRVNHYLLPKQVWETNTRALYYDPVIFAEKLGEKQLRDLPNLRQLFAWKGALFTTSGADEIAKLAKPRGYKANGVNFRLPKEGQLISLSPQDSLQLQEQLGADISEQLYRAVDYYSPIDDLTAGVALTNQWTASDSNSLFPVTGGGLKALHRKSIASLGGSRLFGYRITQTEQIDTVAEVKRNLLTVIKMLPSESLRVTKVKASLEQVIAALLVGVDVIYSDVAVHEAVTGNALVANGKRLNFDHARFANDWGVIDPNCGCSVCTSNYSRAFLHYLAKTDSPQYLNLILEHNLFWLNQFIIKFRSQIN
ncbi:tRNA-guanine transglycosylase [Limosilactobacillus fastidiosus]|uniref:tRNA-guanine transglycosylase n=1 Tax=Limosilactobacillus fastidiosus TaxID=2759855 RepID=A0ABR6E7B4_9LACO|nr:tRNA-guanine transglycosylase [Limosilactobacillus fastidiosus]MBB1063085.1 tRNA-guanine transglycosylase [Limosilactobacillus fastidiosus]MCD7083834.1 queuine tRNA-ribosyltransferase family protein [Limosilactobacillus fastidiosus]